MNTRKLTAKWIKKTALDSIDKDALGSLQKSNYKYDGYSENKLNLLKLNAHKSKPLVNLKNNVESLQNQLRKAKQSGTIGHDLTRFANEGVKEIEMQFHRDIAKHLSECEGVVEALKKRYEKDRYKSSEVNKNLLQNMESEKRYANKSKEELEKLHQDVVAGTFDGSPFEVDLLIGELRKNKLSKEAETTVEYAEKNDYYRPWLRTPEGEQVKQAIAPFAELEDKNHVIVPVDKEDGGTALLGHKITDFINPDPHIENKPTFQTTQE